MSKPAIRVENISKRYQLGVRETGYTTLREALMRAALSPLRRMRELSGASATESVWACRDISFDVQPGEVLGIIGRNGAGKSTLLKIISRITEPTTGRVVFRGRVGSLLEVGTGFHPELTGRENVFLNGAILGMSRAEVRRKFDAIVDFSEIEQFLDTPVKRYSSGMHMRLAFAVAAHLEPEIMVVDEVLAVGDQHFQRKCLGKMDEISKHGRTVLFVSHSMLAVQRLCTRALLLDRGTLVNDGTPRDIASYYLSHSLQSTYEGQPKDTPHIVEAHIETEEGEQAATHFTDRPFYIAFTWRSPKLAPNLRVAIAINSGHGTTICSSVPEDFDLRTPSQPGVYHARVQVPADLLLAGDYTLTIALWESGRLYDRPDPAISFRLEPGPSSFAYRNENGREGLIQLRCNWEVKSEDDLPCPKSSAELPAIEHDVGATCEDAGLGRSRSQEVGL